MKTYSSKRLSDLDDDTQEQLKARVNAISATVNQEYNRGIEEIEEEGPSIAYDTDFKPGGWVGDFAPGVTVEPRFFDEDPYTQLIRDIQDWVEILGTETITSSFGFSPDLLLDQEARLVPYSRALEKYTENVLSNRLPVSVSHENISSPSLRGRIKVDATVRKQAQRSPDVVSQRTRFSLDSLPNLLFVRFHAELANKLSSLANDYSHYETLSRRVSYHRGVLNESPFDQLFSKSLETPVVEPTVIDEARSEASKEFNYIIDLWEGYLRDVNLTFVVKDLLETGVKPMSVTYELWVLRQLLELLEEISGQKPACKSVGETYRLGQYVLHYNQSMKKGHDTEMPTLSSQYFEPNLGHTSGDPDFVVSYNGTPFWIGDAKCTRELQTKHLRQVLGYGVDLLPPNQGGYCALLSANDEIDTFEGDVREYRLQNICLRPGPKSTGHQQLKESVLNALAGYRMAE